MGGRGKIIGTQAYQATIDDQLRQNNISKIIEINEEYRDKIVSGDMKSDNKNTEVAYKKCACCGEYSIEVGGTNQKCDICGWIDDKFQNENPKSENGPNPISLNQAKSLFFKKA